MSAFVRLRERFNGVNTYDAKRDFERITRIDRRFNITDPFPSPLSVNESASLITNLSGLAHDIAYVEQKAFSDFGIQRTFDTIEVRIPINSNNMFEGPAGRLTMIVGDPSTYQTFFHFGKAIYAHETGHLLAHYDLNGFDRFDGSEYNNESLYLQLASILNHGDPSYMYFSGISYQMIPRAILTSSLFGTRGAYYFLNELIAHKFALELVGETEMAKYAANRTGNIGYCPHNNPFYLMSESILARAFGLKDNERAIKAELVKIDPMWLCGSNLPFVEDQFIRFFEQTQVKRLK